MPASKTTAITVVTIITVTRFPDIGGFSRFELVPSAKQNKVMQKTLPPIDRMLMQYFKELCQGKGYLYQKLVHELRDRGHHQHTPVN